MHLVGSGESHTRLAAALAGRVPSLLPLSARLLSPPAFLWPLCNWPVWISGSLRRFREMSRQDTCSHPFRPCKFPGCSLSWPRTKPAAC